MHMAQLMPLPLTVSCFSKIQIGFTFLAPAYPGSPGQRAVKRVCVAFGPLLPNNKLRCYCDVMRVDGRCLWRLLLRAAAAHLQAAEVNSAQRPVRHRSDSPGDDTPDSSMERRVAAAAGCGHGAAPSDHELTHTAGRAEMERSDGDSGDQLTFQHYHHHHQHHQQQQQQAGHSQEHVSFTVLSDNADFISFYTAQNRAFIAITNSNDPH